MLKHLLLLPTLLLFFSLLPPTYSLFNPKRMTSQRYTALHGELRLLIHGTKNAYTTVRKNDMILYKLDSEVDGCIMGLGIFDGKDVRSVCMDKDDSSKFLVDRSRDALNAEDMKANGRLLRIVSSDKTGDCYRIDEYLDNNVYIPVETDPKPKLVPSNPSQPPTLDIERISQLLVEALGLLGSPTAGNKLEPISVQSKKVLVSKLYSHAMIAQGMVYTSGIIATNFDSGGFIKGDIRQQTVQVFENLKEILLAAGSDLRKVITVKLILANLEDLEEVNAIYLQYFPSTSPQPTRTCFSVNGIPLNALIEIEVVALQNC